MKNLISCEFNMDTGCVELLYGDGGMIAIDCTAVEREVADNLHQRSELDYLIYNDPLSYAELVLNGDPEFMLSNAASKYFKEHGITKLPSTKALQAEIQQLTSEKNTLYKDYQEKQRRVKGLETVKNNLENILGHKKEKRHELIPS